MTSPNSSAAGFPPSMQHMGEPASGGLPHHLQALPTAKGVLRLSSHVLKGRLFKPTIARVNRRRPHFDKPLSLTAGEGWGSGHGIEPIVIFVRASRFIIQAVKQPLRCLTQSFGFGAIHFAFPVFFQINHFAHSGVPFSFAPTDSNQQTRKDLFCVTNLLSGITK